MQEANRFRQIQCGCGIGHWSAECFRRWWMRSFQTMAKPRTTARRQKKTKIKRLVRAASITGMAIFMTTARATAVTDSGAVPIRLAVQGFVDPSATVGEATILFGIGGSLLLLGRLGRKRFLFPPSRTVAPAEQIEKVLPMPDDDRENRSMFRAKSLESHL